MQTQNRPFQRRLPHIYLPEQPIFITWRLKFDLPKPVLNELERIKQEYTAETEKLSDEFRKMQNYINHKRIFGWLDSQYDKIDPGDVSLNSKEIGSILKDTILAQQELDYHVYAFCIMPNHVHVLMTPYCASEFVNKSLSDILKKWKGSSARAINLHLNRSGSLWSPESYDHLVRNVDELSRVMDYIIQNPVSARLVHSWKDWEYTWIDNQTYGYLK